MIFCLRFLLSASFVLLSSISQQRKVIYSASCSAASMSSNVNASSIGDKLVETRTAVLDSAKSAYD